MKIKCKNPVCQCTWETEGLPYYCCPRCGDLQEVNFLQVVFEQRQSLYLGIRDFQRSWLRVDLIYAIVWSFFCVIIFASFRIDLYIGDWSINPFRPQKFPILPIALLKIRQTLILLCLVFLSCPYRTVVYRQVWKSHYSFWFTRMGIALKVTLLVLFFAWSWFWALPLYQRQMEAIVKAQDHPFPYPYFPDFSIRFAMLWTLVIQTCEAITRKVMKKRCIRLQPGPAPR